MFVELIRLGEVLVVRDSTTRMPPEPEPQRRRRGKLREWLHGILDVCCTLGSPVLVVPFLRPQEQIVDVEDLARPQETPHSHHEGREGPPTLTPPGKPSTTQGAKDPKDAGGCSGSEARPAA